MDEIGVPEGAKSAIFWLEIEVQGVIVRSSVSGWFVLEQTGSGVAQCLFIVHIAALCHQGGNQLFSFVAAVDAWKGVVWHGRLKKFA